MNHPPVIHWAAVAPGMAAHLAATIVHARQPVGVHGHDFAECYWVESGTGRQRCGAQETALAQGRLVCLHEGHVHAIEGDGLRLVNLALPSARLTALAELAPSFARWRAADEPLVVDIGSLGLRQLGQLVASAPGPGIEAHAALRLLSAVGALLDAEPVPAVPAWLVQCEAAVRAEPAAFTRASDLVAVSGYSREYVWRSVRRAFACSPSQYLVQARLDEAARRLQQSQASVLSIALDCGFDNQSYFHRRFKERFGVTPLAYRRQARMTLPL